MRARNLGFFAAFLVLVWAALAVPARAALDVDFGRYQALVIGINEYKNLPKLETAVNDATAVADVLRQRYGFEVTLLLNPGRSEVIRAMDKLRGELTERDNLLIYMIEGLVEATNGPGSVGFLPAAGFALAPVGDGVAGGAVCVRPAPGTRGVVFTEDLKTTIELVDIA